jgi:hypothetical protein
VNDLQAQADKFIEKEHHDSITIKEKAETITTRYEKYGTVKWNENSFFQKSTLLKMFDFAVILGLQTWRVNAVLD